MLEIGHADGEWVALCNGFRGVGSSADEALRLALDDETSPIGAAAATLAAWIREQAATLEREVEQGA
jgi:hypothetical protein